MVRVSWKLTLGCAWASAIVLSTLTGCSGDDADPGGTSGGSGGTAGAAGTGGAAGSGGTGASSGAGGSSGATGGSGGSQTGGASSTGGGGGSGGSTPASNCGDLSCTSAQICIESEALFAGEDSNECAAPPDGCAAWMLCDCNIPDWNGAPIWGCSAFSTSTLYVYDLSCGDAPCDDGKVCLVDETESSPPTCVDAPAACTVDDTFCDTGCGEQVAEAAGMDYVSCRASSAGAGVTVAPSD
jgi:hypothetical protein